MGHFYDFHPTVEVPQAAFLAALKGPLTLKGSFGGTWRAAAGWELPESALPLLAQMAVRMINYHL